MMLKSYQQLEQELQFAQWKVEKLTELAYSVRAILVSKFKKHKDDGTIYLTNDDLRRLDNEIDAHLKAIGCDE